MRQLLLPCICSCSGGSKRSICSPCRHWAGGRSMSVKPNTWIAAVEIDPTNSRSRSTVLPPNAWTTAWLTTKRSRFSSVSSCSFLAFTKWGLSVQSGRPQFTVVAVQRGLYVTLDGEDRSACASAQHQTCPLLLAP